ncbi:MAG: DoxX family protein [Planctomycetes bacterium]|nr:DoxX family protein [Planctomycetota bacterium]
MSRTSNRLAWALQLVAALILAQTLFFKFSGAAESRYIFETLGAEPWGRWGSGLVELTAVGLLLRARTAVLGAGLAAGTMAGALGAHLTTLGIEVQGDGGTLFALALVTLACALGVLGLRRADLARWIERLRPRAS